ncbi:mannose-6-phosphate isomerase type 1 [Halanaerobium saccharolyticum]|uniref:Phosphohexomutase n=1 Tax=Halanaerobium saccharolyticum TaxID=43595 RepID=A0A4V3G3V2_9FIRM|nr:type I phosphomannose isomerase catalytic subunit [Halanaerobium saccharolyticum]RAK08505.1 mannose-6-phosphate isomerase type 1 [Halanaerobium saccharolyticum]TDV97917.1 mannose-6-phosphate isomerase type 1 [Halanaerobium saccharolyticum]TDX59997.1 mannose-6-phosphate isomerase type 1 [Halanaerobium saccharolyticum]
MFYPLKFDHKYVEKIWGGRKFEKFRDDLPEGPIGESWDVSAQESGMSIAQNGKLAGKSLKELTEMYPQQILGKDIEADQFPLLLKIIDAQSQLSIQVHPDDQYAAKYPGEAGKTEAWYVIDADEDAYLIIGTEDCTESEFKKAVKNDEINQFVKKVRVEKGDVFFIKAGLLHAIGPGIMLAEIQQSSDTTYRVYDYGRGRELHLSKALDVIDFKLDSEKRKGLRVCQEDYNYSYYCLNDKFALDIIKIKESYQAKGDQERFYILTVVEGSGKISWDDQEIELNETESVLIPAYSEEFKIKGDLKLMKSYVPDLEENREQILSVIE